MVSPRARNPAARSTAWEAATKADRHALAAELDELSRVLRDRQHLRLGLRGRERTVDADHVARAAIGGEADQHAGMGRAGHRADDDVVELDAELALLRKIETAAKLACGLLWMTAEWRQGKADAAYKALLEAVGGSGSQGLRESIEAALAAGHEVDAPPGCYWPGE